MTETKGVVVLGRSGLAEFENKRGTRRAYIVYEVRDEKGHYDVGFSSAKFGWIGEGIPKGKLTMAPKWYKEVLRSMGEPL